MTGYSLLTYQSNDGPRAGVVVSQAVFDAVELASQPSYMTMLGILEDWVRAKDIIQSALVDWESFRCWRLSDTHARAPVLWPSAIYCAGANYRDHAAEMARRMGREPDPDPRTSGGKPWHFVKSPHSIADPGAVIEATHYSKKLDWEIELAAVIGVAAKKVPVERALDYVAGYTIANDLSARDLSRRTNTPPGTPFHFDWIGQKCFDGACPLGPFIVPKDDIADPQNLSLKLSVNDVLKQDSNTSQMIFTLAEQIAQLSLGMTLHPGDLILTGTPAGVGAGRAEFLQSGDVVRVEIERIGSFANTIR